MALDRQRGNWKVWTIDWSTLISEIVKRVDKTGYTKDYVS